MIYTLDANACISLLTNSSLPLTRRAGSCEAGSIVISTVAFAEVALGSANAKPPSMALLEALLSEIPLIEFDEAAARAYATLPFRRGRFDRLVAAHALSRGLTVVTSNVRDFVGVAGLRVEDWTLPT